jgi:hypothetical protein
MRNAMIDATKPNTQPNKSDNFTSISAESSGGEFTVSDLTQLQLSIRPPGYEINPNGPLVPRRPYGLSAESRAKASTNELSSFHRGIVSALRELDLAFRSYHLTSNM